VGKITAKPVLGHTRLSASEQCTAMIRMMEVNMGMAIDVRERIAKALAELQAA
jgi:hypothetical protein